MNCTVVITRVIMNIRMTEDESAKEWYETSSVISFRLRPETIALLKELSVVYGGVGRAIQIATELLWVPWQPETKWKEEPKIMELPDTGDKPQALFSFAAFPRTKKLIELLAVRHYDGRKNNVIRACVKVLYNIQRVAGPEFPVITVMSHEDYAKLKSNRREHKRR